MCSITKRLLLNSSVAIGALVLSVISPARSGALQTDQDIKVNVARAGDLLKVRADFFVPVAPSQAFAVLTDYDHMRDFLPDVAESKVIQRAGDKLLVSQSLRMKLGIFSVPFDSVRLVELKPPYRLVSHAVSGTISKAEVTTTLVEAQGKTLVTYESEASLSSWLPAGIGNSFVATHVREQLTSMRLEMLRRQSSTKSVHTAGGEPATSGP